jgi:hypothetical protein
MVLAMVHWVQGMQCAVLAVGHWAWGVWHMVLAVRHQVWGTRCGAAGSAAASVGGSAAAGVGGITFDVSYSLQNHNWCNQHHAYFQGATSCSTMGDHAILVYMSYHVPTLLKN